MFSPICRNIFKVSQKKIQVPLPCCSLLYFFFGIKHICFKYTEHYVSTSKGRQCLIDPMHGKTFWPHGELQRTSQEAKMIYSQHLQRTSHGYYTVCCQTVKLASNISQGTCLFRKGILSSASEDYRSEVELSFCLKGSSCKELSSSKWSLKASLQQSLLLAEPLHKPGAGWKKEPFAPSNSNETSAIILSTEENGLSHHWPCLIHKQRDSAKELEFEGCHWSVLYQDTWAGE